MQTLRLQPGDLVELITDDLRLKQQTIKRTGYVVQVHPKWVAIDWGKYRECFLRTDLAQRLLGVWR